MSRRVLCIGNELASDDGVGIRVGRVLSTLPLPADVQVVMKRMVGLDLLDEEEAVDELILVDAACTGAPLGSCRAMELDDMRSMARTPFCCHGVGLAELLTVVERVRPSAVPRAVKLVAIEVNAIDVCGTRLSGEAQRALPDAVEMVLGLLGATDELRHLGIARAEAMAEWEPSPLEIIG